MADPATGVAVYDSVTFEETSGWLTFGGTSAGAPMIAAAFALAGNTADVADGSYVWTHHRSGVNDVSCQVVVLRSEQPLPLLSHALSVQPRRARDERRSEVPPTAVTHFDDAG